MTAPLRPFKSLTRELETFPPVHPGEAPDFVAEARVYSCAPTVSNYPHIRIGHDVTRHQRPAVASNSP